MKRRTFLGALLGTTAAGAAAATVELPSAPPASPAFPAVHKSIQIPVACDLSECGVEDAIIAIARATGRFPSVVRLITPPELAFMANRIKKAASGGSCEIVTVVDFNQKDHDYWSVDALGVRVWSPGA